ncbi:hypothetical protein KCU98_g1175, partial [Aureobasidium melanogenum]
MSSEKVPSFDPAECASLHNHILERAIQQSPDTAQPSRDTLQACSDAIRARLLPDIQEFLATITVRSASPASTPLTPFSLQPDPERFFQHTELPQFAEYKDNLVMLYPAKDTAGGLFFLQQHKIASWIDSDLKLPSKSSWLPLASILKRWLHMWDTGKITSGPKLQPWCEGDLQATLKAWDELVDAIQDKRPKPVPRPPTPAPLIEHSVAATWAEQSFQHAFLTRARRPAFSCLAPGMHMWSTKAFEAAHAAEPQDSERKQVIGRKPDDPEDYQSALSRDLAPTLLFPGRAVESTWRDPSKPSLRDYKGRGSALLNRKAGLYLCPVEGWSDAVVFSDGRGRENVFTYRGSCPWMPGRPPALLRDVLKSWKTIVVNGNWPVRDTGVFGNMMYFHSLGGNLESADVHWNWEVATSF